MAADGVIRFTPTTAAATEIGKIKLARFARPAALDRDGEYNLPTADSGNPQRGFPTQNGFGSIVTGVLED